MSCIHPFPSPSPTQQKEDVNDKVASDARKNRGKMERWGVSERRRKIAYTVAESDAGKNRRKKDRRGVREGGRQCVTKGRTARRWRNEECRKQGGTQSIIPSDCPAAAAWWAYCPCTSPRSTCPARQWPRQTPTNKREMLIYQYLHYNTSLSHVLPHPSQKRTVSW